jgi:CBS domain-containing protein
MAKTLPIHRRMVLSGDGSCATAEAVFCPIREQSIATHACVHCPRVVSVDRTRDGSVVCESSAMWQRRGDTDLAEAAARVRLGELMRGRAVAVREDVDVETLERLILDERLGCVPVTGPHGEVIGIVSATDLLSRAADGTAEVPPATARDVMTPGPRCLPEDARLSQAIALMALEGIAHVPVVDGLGVLVGVVNEGDAVRWMAQRMGYVVPGGDQGGIS